MGLDMYLTAEKFLRNPEREKVRIEGISVPSGIPIRKIIFEVGYWRKANAIHKWFVENVQKGKDNCEKYQVSKEQLENLRALVIKALAERDSVEKILPTKGGFFFGSLEYDTFYWQDLADTLKIIEVVLGFPKDGFWTFYYQSSW